MEYLKRSLGNSLVRFVPNFFLSTHVHPFITSQYNVPRENVVIITKVGFLVDHEQMHNITSIPSIRPGMADTRDYVNQGGLSRAAIFNQTEECLSRLGTDYVDVLMIHIVDLQTPFTETMRALHDIVLSGKARYLGASNVRAWQFIEMNNIAERKGWTTFSCVQMEHSLLYRAEVRIASFTTHTPPPSYAKSTWKERELFAYCHYKGVGILAYAPLMDGHLARPIGTQTIRTKRYASVGAEKPRRATDITIIKRVQELAEKKSWKMSQVALAWLTNQHSIPIVGISTV